MIYSQTKRIFTVLDEQFCNTLLDQKKSGFEEATVLPCFFYILCTLSLCYIILDNSYSLHIIKVHKNF